MENDLSPGQGKTRAASAFKRRKILLPDGRKELRTVRPGFRKALDMLSRGEADGFLALDLDRTVRDPRDLEDLIDVVEASKPRVQVESVTGSLRLANDADITMARVMVAMANKASRDTARRVSAARERQALAGEFAGGRRPFGHEDDGITLIEAETKLVNDFSIKALQGASLRSLAAEWRRRGLPTVTGADMTAATLKDLLLRPRNIGRMVYQGEEVADAPWKGYVKVEVFRALQDKFGDPARQSGPGPAPRWLGSGVYMCGICTPVSLERPVFCEVTRANKAPAYKCKDKAHLIRSVKHVDALVVGVVLGRMLREDAIDLLRPAAPEVDVKELRAERKAIRTNLDEMAADKALGLIDRAQLIKATAIGKARMDEIDALLTPASVDSPLKPLIEADADEIEAVWEGLGLAHQQLVINTLVTVRILTAPRGGRGFDPAGVDVRLREDTDS
ncbi:recombinase family protein [Longispora albida]|uniref:recombinase family protein n=1 Tax=Longispora albida TaxID=203523 RepID=UPI001FDF5A48|nr:recombinase family protein [Longispora albida]